MSVLLKIPEKEKGKKIAMLLGAVSFGGGERVLERVAKDLLERGESLIIYTYRREWLDAIADLGDRAEVRLLKKRPTMLRKPASFIEIRRALQQDRPDLLLTFEQELAETAIPAARSLGVPTIISERCDPRFFPARKIHRALRRLTFSLADAIIFQTPQVRDWFGPRLARKGTVIPNPILDRNLKDPVPWEKRDRLIVSAGSLDTLKNQASLIRAFGRLEAEDWRLVIYGEGESRPELEKLVRELGLQGRVILPGKVSRVVDHIAYARIFVLTSRCEGLPNALTEGMAMGLACISTDFPSGGARMLIEPGRNGLLVESDTRRRPVSEPDERLERRLVEAMRSLIRDDSLARRLGESAVEVRQRFAAPQIIDRWQRLISSLTERNGG